jgi:hypothetical protein
MTRIRLLLKAAAIGAYALSSATALSKSDAHSFSVDFQQKFKSTACPAGAPDGFYCLYVTGKAKTSALGTLTFERTVFFDLRKFDKQHPTCIPDETSGRLVLPKGSLKFRAPGSVCMIDGTANYGLIITGGTGAYEGAVGAGRITVPPQTSAGNGRELWQVELF